MYHYNLVVFFCNTLNSNNMQQASEVNTGNVWWKEAIIYQVYPRSFKDSNGDGVGDLKGITEKLDYIQSLGVDAVWLNPIYSSPNDDNGYDVSDYQNIMHEFGTMDDFDEMLSEMHKRNLKLVMDLVVNHSSDEHEWFRQSRSARNNPYRNYYHWWPAENGKPAHRYSHFDVNNDAWTYDSLTDAYYLHYFSKKQPDLNWENPQLRQEIYRMMLFWLDKGVDGFRMDVIPFISKDTSFPELPGSYKGDFVNYYAHGPRLHEYLQEMNREVLSKYDVITVGENVGIAAEEAIDFVDPERQELDMMYHFDGVNMGYVPGKFKTPSPDGYDLVEFKKMYSKWDSVFEEKGWGTIYLGNHDQPRMVSRWGNDDPKWRSLSSRMLTTFLLSMRATPFYYQGDELGMTNIKFDSIDDYRDIESINMYNNIKNNQRDLGEFIDAQKITARDNGRTPMQWDGNKNAGFSDAEPWLKINPGYKTVNVAVEETHPNSCLNYFRKMVRLRKENPVLIYGKYDLLAKDDPNIYAYTRTSGKKKILVLLNFTSGFPKLNINIDFTQATLLCCNYEEPTTTGQLRPYEASIYTLLN